MCAVSLLAALSLRTCHALEDCTCAHIQLCPCKFIASHLFLPLACLTFAYAALQRAHQDGRARAPGSAGRARRACLRKILLSCGRACSGGTCGAGGGRSRERRGQGGVRGARAAAGGAAGCHRRRAGRGRRRAARHCVPWCTWIQSNAAYVAIQAAAAALPGIAAFDVAGSRQCSAVDTQLSTNLGVLLSTQGERQDLALQIIVLHGNIAGNL